jgi:hypothetical protein
MRMINEHQMRQYLGASGAELLKLRILMDPDEQGNYPESAACLALLRIRQGNRARDQITEQHMQQQAQASRERTRRLLGGRRRMTRD